MAADFYLFWLNNCDWYPLAWIRFAYPEEIGCIATFSATYLLGLLSHLALL